MTEEPKRDVEARYSQLSSTRQHFVDRADEMAKLTIPTIFRRMGTAKNAKIKDPDQSVGARGVNALASKMILSLLPVNTPFFKLNIDNITSMGGVSKEELVEIKKGLAVIEKQTVRDVENSGDVVTVFEAVKHLIITGNVLLYVGEKGSRLYDLNKYVVIRNPEGGWSEIVIAEEVSPASVDNAVLAQIASQTDPGKASPEETLTMYTHVRREAGRVIWHQEIKGVLVEGSEGSVPEDANPWLPLRFVRVDGEAYGRGYVEMYVGDLNSLGVLSRAVNDASAAAAKVIFLVRPNGQTSARAIAKAPNLSVRSGDANDVTVLRMDKAADLRVAQEMIAVLERRLAAAFMITADVMRNAERVTAEEIRLVAQELDSSLGGIYSLLSQEFQTPYVRRRLHLLRKAKNSPKLPDIVSPVIVTGFAALGRGHDSEKLLRFLEKVERAVAVSQASGGKVSLDTLIERFAIADGIDTEGLLVSEEELAESQQQQQGMSMVESVAPEMVKQMGPMIQQQLMEGAPDGSSQEIPQG